MRNITVNGGVKVNGTLNILDNSQIYKPLNQFTNEELYVEMEYREGMIKKENVRFFNLWLRISIALLIIAAAGFLWGFFKNSGGFPEYTISVLLLIAPIFLGYNHFSDPPDIIVRHSNVKKEVYMILRERGEL